MPSLLVAFEGMEASGKSTVARMVVKKLGGRWRLTGEPFSPALATLLREALAGYRRELAWSQTAQLYLFAADRFLHVYGVLVAGSLGRVWEEQCYFFEESIALSWLQGFNIITDRYKYSTIVYQGLLPHHPAVRHVWAERGPGPAAVRRWMLEWFPPPHKLVVFVAEPETAWRRAMSRDSQAYLYDNVRALVALYELFAAVARWLERRPEYCHGRDPERLWHRFLRMAGVDPDQVYERGRCYPEVKLLDTTNMLRAGLEAS